MAITKVELANMLLGVESTKKAAAKIKTSAIVGTAHNDSRDGYVLVDLGGDVISVDGKQYVSLATTADVRAGDKVYVLLRGADGTAMGATVIGSAGGGDRTKVDIAAAAAEAAAAKADVSSAISMVNSVKAEADAHESQIDAIQKDIAAYKESATATYATKTEVNEQTGAITKTIEADYTKTTDMESAISAAQTAATDAAKSTVDGMKLGGRNLLKGTSMDVVTGAYPSSSYRDYLAYQTIDVPDGDTYTLSFDAKSTHAGDAISCYFFSPNTTLTGISSTGMKSNDHDGHLRVKLTADWQRYWCTWTQSATTKRKTVIPFRCEAGNGTGTVSMRGVKLEAGNKATDWTPAPEDTDSAVADAKKAGTTAQSQLSSYKSSNDKAVADAKKAGTDAQSDLDAYKGTVSETYAEKTELTEAVNQLSSTMSSNYTAFTDYRKTNDTALSKAQTDATNAKSTIDSYKASNDKAVADAKAAGTTAQNQLSAYKGTNDQAVADAKKAGTDAQSQLGSYKTATDQRLDELKNIADNAIETWYLKGVPTTSNAPAKDWTTDALKKRHAGDLYMDVDTGYSYRWSGTAWVQVKDSDVTKALKEIQSVKTTYATKSELKATDTELSGKVSDSLTTAKAYTDSSIETEVTNRDAAIKAQADSISLSVSKTYTKSETFSAYQSDADSRIATANSNASTAVSTAKTAASDAATAKTNASSAVSTANAAKSTAQTASTNASNAVSTANSANSKSDSAVSTANSAKSAASTATSTANTAKSTADTAKSTADAVNRAAVKTYPYPNSLGVSNWVHLGDWSNTRDSHTLKIDLLSGDGYNAGTTQNSTVEIFVKDAHQSTASATYAYGATVTLGQLDRSKCHVDVIATSATACSIWVKLDFVYDAGSYTVAMTPGDSWTHSGAVSSTEPTGTKQNVAFLTNAEEANAAAGAAQTSANNAQKAADKAQSSADDTAAALAKAAVRIRIDGTPMADGTSQLVAHVYVGNDEVPSNAIAKLGTLVWKMDGVADRRGTTTYTAQTGKFVTCRLEA